MMLPLTLLFTLTTPAVCPVVNHQLGIKQRVDICTQLSGCNAVEFNQPLLQCMINMGVKEQPFSQKQSVHRDCQRIKTSCPGCKMMETCIGRLTKKCVSIGKRSKDAVKTCVDGEWKCRNPPLKLQSIPQNSNNVNFTTSLKFTRTDLFYVFVNIHLTMPDHPRKHAPLLNYIILDGKHEIKATVEEFIRDSNLIIKFGVKKLATLLGFECRLVSFIQSRDALVVMPMINYGKISRMDERFANAFDISEHNGYLHLKQTVRRPNSEAYVFCSQFEELKFLPGKKWP